MRYFNTTATNIGVAHVTIENHGQWVTGVIINFDHHGEVIQKIERTFASDCLPDIIIKHLVAEINAG